MSKTLRCDLQSKPCESNVKFLKESTRSVASDLFEAYGGPTALGLYLCLKYGDDVSACSHSIDPNCFSEIEDFKSAYLAASLLSKFKSGPKGHDEVRKQRALQKFTSCEERLKGVHKSLKAALGTECATGRVIRRAGEIIESILGDPRDSFDISDCSFGPGSSSSIPRSKAHPSHKYLAVEVTAACAPLVAWFFQDSRFSRPAFKLVEHSRVECVPKSFKIDRIIFVEPDWNIFFQKGIGAAIRKRLRLHGLDLDTVAERHGRLARLGSKTAELATIDLSAASDSLSTTLMRHLLSPVWFDLLNSVRTNQVRMENGDIVPLRKFSSMGNGFTFELESLVFYALAKAACIEVHECTRSVSVFGDDIILPTSVVPLLREVFDSLGFVINTDKSFWTGFFRESCGYHYFKGMDVKPIYLKEDIINDSTKFKVCNQIRRLSLRCFHADVCDTVLFLPYSNCRSRIRREFLIPDGYGDGGLISTFDEAIPAVRRKDSSVRRHPNCIEGYKVRCLLPATRSGSSETAGMLMYKLRSLDRQRRSSFLRGGPSLWLDLRDLPDKEPQIFGNEFYLPPIGSPRPRVGFIHVPRWLNPGEA